MEVEDEWADRMLPTKVQLELIPPKQ